MNIIIALRVPKMQHMFRHSSGPVHPGSAYAGTLFIIYGYVYVTGLSLDSTFTILKFNVTTSPVYVAADRCTVISCFYALRFPVDAEMCVVLVSDVLLCAHSCITQAN